MIKLLGRIRYSSSERATFTRFAGVGVTISLIDAGGLYILMSLGINAYIARIFSYTASMTAGYLLNRYITFHHLETGRALWHSLVRHYSVHSVGGALNFTVFSMILLLGQNMGGQIAASATLPLVGVWIGGMFGLCFNFFFSKKLVFDN
ncbi:MAG: GtrA family protein [Verrucomicrobiota bacterium]